MTTKKLNYVKERLKGKSKQQAALAAGYAATTARNVADAIETPDVKALFQRLIQQRIPMEKIAARLEEGMDATEVKVFATKEGIVMSDPLIAWTERRKYAELAAQYGGYHQAVKPADPTDMSKTQNNFIFLLPAETVQ